MKTTSKILKIINILFLILTLIFLIVQWNQIPMQIPTHYDLYGTMDNYGQKNSLIGFFIIELVIYLLLKGIQWIVKLAINSSDTKKSFKLYLYFLQNRFRKKWKIALEELKENILEVSDIETYSQYKFLNAYILKPSIKEINEKTNLEIKYFSIKKGNRIHTLEFTCHFKDTNELINGEFKEKDIPSISSNLTWDEIENDMEYGSLEYVIAEIQYTFKSVNKKEELNKAELGIIKELYELYGGRMMVVASREASTYEKYSLYYMKELMKTWVMKGYSAEDVENGKR